MAPEQQSLSDIEMMARLNGWQVVDGPYAHTLSRPGCCVGTGIDPLDDYDLILVLDEACDRHKIEYRMDRTLYPVKFHACMWPEGEPYAFQGMAICDELADTRRESILLALRKLDEWVTKKEKP